MRTARPSSSPSRFLGVRLSEEEEARLEAFRQARELANRSEAVRALVRESAEPRSGSFELPVTLRGKIEALVEDGHVATTESAVQTMLLLGLRELERIYEGTSKMHEDSLHDQERREVRRGAEREGRRLLGR